MKITREQSIKLIKKYGMIKIRTTYNVKFTTNIPDEYILIDEEVIKLENL